MPLLILVAALELAVPAGAAESVLEAENTAGQRIRVLVTTFDDGKAPRAVLLLFAGGDGRIGIGDDGTMKRFKRNFLVRSRAALAARGFITAVVDAPQNKLVPPGLVGGYRASAAHAQDIAAVVKAVTEAHPGLPVYAVGTSRGTVSAANAAVRLGGAGISGAALTASLVERHAKGANIRDVGLEKAAVPLLFVHHRRDGCRLTPFAGTERYAKSLAVRGREVTFKAVSGGSAEGNPCRSQSHHGFLGVEDEVLDAIAAWVAAIPR